MDLLKVLLVFGLVFGGMLFLLLRRIWMRFRMIAVAIPVGSDPQASRYKLTEAIRFEGYREEAGAEPGAEFRAPALQRVFGFQNISVSPAVSQTVLVTGPELHVSRIGRSFAGAIPRPYESRQPVWPLVKSFLRIFAILIVLGAASGLALYLAGS